MTTGSIIAYVFLAPLAGLTSLALLMILNLVIFFAAKLDFERFTKHDKYLMLGSVLLAEIVFGALHVGAYFDHRIELSKQAIIENERLYNKAIESERKACHDAGYGEPYWAEIHESNNSTTTIFLCGNGHGYSQSIDPPLCNRKWLNSCK